MFEARKQVEEALRHGFRNLSVLVIGDLILDRYLWGEVTRISPESPVPVVQLVRENEVGGGGANVALNLAGLGLRATVAGFVGQDNNRGRLLAILQDNGIDTGGVVALPNWPTITKTRVIGGKQQMIRIDREETLQARQQDVEALWHAVSRQIAERPDAIILSDYAKGVLTHDFCCRVIKACRDLKIPVFVDPKGRSFDKYHGATAITPNRAELAMACGKSPHPLNGLLEAGQALSRQLHLDFMAVTLGELGIALIEQEDISHIPALAREVFDVSGAGDTVVATITAAQIGGLSRFDSLYLANLAAGVVVGKVGTAPIFWQELLAALSTAQALAQSEKICTLEIMLDRLGEWRARGERIVFTNGCFDLLHAGHVKLLEEAKRLGNRLIVGLNTDRSVRALKGEGRPVIGEEDRARVLAALSAVDAVILFDEDTPIELIRAIKPEVLTKGNDYTMEQVVGAEEIKAWKGEVTLIDLVEGKSSSGIVKTLRAG